ncbi:MAG: hypothetical protein JWR19_2918 [Pedosphaera sp.]|nr:hypothetical protein [Pedosphaera sp.]
MFIKIKDFAMAKPLNSSPNAALHKRQIMLIWDLAASQPVAERIALYRWLADICGDVTDAQKFRQTADDLEIAELRARETRFHYGHNP